MAITQIASNSSGSASVTLPAGILAGDLITVYAHKTSLTAPTTPTGFASLSTQSANSNSHKGAGKTAVGTESGTSVTSTNATSITVVVHRGASGYGAASGTNNAASTTTNIAAIPTLNVTNGTSWVVTGAASSQAVSQSTPSGRTLRQTVSSATDSINLSDTNGGVTSAPLNTSTAGASAVGCGFQVELIATVTAAPGNFLLLF